MTTAYRLAVQQAAREYDPQALALRNVREGLATERLAHELADCFEWLAAEQRGSLQRDDEHEQAERAADCIQSVVALVSAEPVSAALQLWTDNELIEGVDY